MRFNDKVVIVTGGGSGMGLAAAKLFASEGASVAVNDINPETAAAAVRSIEAQGGTAVAIVGDITDRDFAETSVGDVVSRFGKIDILLNNAGFATVKPAVDYTDWDRTLAINLSAHFHWARAAGVRSMIPNRGGVIVNTASIAGHVGYPGDIGYIAAKHGLIGLTRGLAIEWAPHNIRVNCVCPGLTDSPMLRDVEKIDPDRFVVRRKRVPMGRSARPEEIADAMAFLCSSHSSYITGAILNVDGGQMALSSGWSPA